MKLSVFDLPSFVVRQKGLLALASQLSLSAWDQRWLQDQLQAQKLLEGMDARALGLEAHGLHVAIPGPRTTKAIWANLFCFGVEAVNFQRVTFGWRLGDRKAAN